MRRHLEDTIRGSPRRTAGLLAAAFALGATMLADLTGTRGEDHYALSLVLPGWFVGVAALAAAGAWLLHRRAARAAAPTHEEAAGDPDARASEAASTDPEPAPAEWIAVRSPRAITLVEVDRISHVQADGRYARIHSADGQHLAQHSLAELEQMLDGARFVRVHRSAIVNLRRIRSLRTDDYRDFALLLDDGTEMRLSRTYRARLESALGLRL